MAKAGFAARLGAAAFLAGVSLAVPQSVAIATADRGDTGSPADTSSASTPGTSGPSVGRGSRPAPRGGIDRTPVASPPRAAATGRSVGEARRTGASPAESPEPVVGPVEPARDIPVPSPAVTVPAVTVPTVTDSVAVAAANEAPPTPAALVTPPSPAHPGALAAVTASAGANAASASLIDTLLAPIRAIFGEGTALLVRRSLFNQAPTTAPVQLTGQSEGPITGTIGAVDLEGDPLSYAVTATPLHGSAVVNADGSYTYTPGTGFTGTDSFVVDVTDTGFHINLLDLFRPASTSASVPVAQGALAAMLRFQFIYGSGSQYWSSAARAALESAAHELASTIVVNSPVTITYDVTGAKSPFSSTLASAGSDFVNNDTGFLQTVVQNKILSGADANGSAADGTIDWNFGPSWAFGSVSNTAYDFESIAMHELLHTFGFLSNIDEAGSNTGTVWTVFDSYVVNSAGTHTSIFGKYWLIARLV